jgi:hypothetical protein
VRLTSFLYTWIRVCYDGLKDAIEADARTKDVIMSGALLRISPHRCPHLLPSYHILSYSSTTTSLSPKFTYPLISLFDAPWSYIFPWIDSPRYTSPFSTFYLERHHTLKYIFEWIPPSRVEVIYFSRCVFLIGDLDCMILLVNVYILSITPSEIRLIGTKVLEPYILS